MIKPSQTAGIGVAAALAMGLAANAQRLPDMPASPRQITGTSAPVMAKDDGCNAECVEMIFEVVKVAINIAVRQYELDKLRCAQNYDPDEEKKCIKSAFNKAIKNVVVLAGAGGSAVYLTYNWDSVDRARQSLVNRFSRRNENTELSEKPPEYPDKPEQGSSGPRPDLYADMHQRVSPKAKSGPKAEL